MKKEQVLAPARRISQQAENKQGGEAMTKVKKSIIEQLEKDGVRVSTFGRSTLERLFRKDPKLEADVVKLHKAIKKFEKEENVEIIEFVESYGKDEVSYELIIEIDPSSVYKVKKLCTMIGELGLTEKIFIVIEYQCGSVFDTGFIFGCNERRKKDVENT